MTTIIIPIVFVIEEISLNSSTFCKIFPNLINKIEVGITPKTSDQNKIFNFISDTGATSIINQFGINGLNIEKDMSHMI